MANIAKKISPIANGYGAIQIEAIELIANPYQVAVYAYLCAHSGGIIPDLTIREIAEATGMAEKTARKALRDLSRKRMVDGSTYSPVYV